MTAAGPSVVDLSVDAFAFAVTGASLYFVARQKPSQYPYLKSLLILVHVLFEAIIFQDVLRNLASSPSQVAVYSEFAATMVFADVVLLTLTAYSVYVRPGGKGLVPRLEALFLRWPHGVILGAYIAYIAALAAYVVLEMPFTVVQLISLGGTPLYSPRFNGTYLLAAGAVLAFFLAYPTFLLVRETLSVKDPALRRSFVLLPFCWVGIGTEILFFNGLLVRVGYDYVALGYAIAAFLFGVTASIFRRTSVLSTFFEPVKGPPGGVKPMVAEAGSVLDAGVPVLLEVDPSSDYETALAKFALGKTSSGGLVFVFTTRGSPVCGALADAPGVRFYLMTSQVSYPTRSTKENELLVPQNDMAVLLDLMDKTISSTGRTPLALVLDSITDYVLYLGFESTYKFLKQANEILDKRRISPVFLMVGGAHDERTTSLVRSLFRVHAAYKWGELRVTRGPGSTPA